MKTPVCVIRKKDGIVLVRADLDTQIRRSEDDYYFDPALIDEHFVVSKRAHHCPHKGISHWVDYFSPQGIVANVAWVYDTPLDDYEYIAGLYGFYPDHRYYQIEECSAP